MAFCYFCKHHTFASNTKSEVERIKNLIRPYSECKCELGQEEHNYFPTFGNDCCIINPTDCEKFEQS